ncbi:Cytochrome b561 domain-containing protein [Mycena sanguinolenta]|uniref:Cytochrome b561 domain-containing protein n=1 Tax=Mycena sanguinolenta TaxID=230812 RepID=A0A8H6YNJ8_9AGAR|nr:Cytochrome b561 domain-containing protein [Mycena sanguinolenta]
MLSFRFSSLLLLLWFQSLVAVGATSVGDSGCGLFFCLNVTVTDDIMTYQITPIFEPFGWVGLGFGRQMKDTHMVVVWEKEEDRSPVLSHRYGHGHVEPEVDEHPPRVASIVPASVTINPSIAHTHSNYSTIAFQIPLNRTNPKPGQVIWAYSLRQPGPYPSAELLQHYAAGTIDMPLNKVVADLPGTIENALDNPLPRYQKLIWHGILLSIGFLVLLPMGSLIARWGRTLTPRWFKAHRFLNLGLALPAICGGFILGPLAVLDREARHFADVHQICGLLLVALYGAQLLLGRYIHSRRDVVGRPPHPPSNMLHALLGIFIITGAFLQVRSGFEEWSMSTQQPAISHWCHDALTAWSVILPLLYFGGLVLLKRQLAQEKNGQECDDSPERKNYIALHPATAIFAGHEQEMEFEVAAYSEFDNAPLLSRA